MAYDITNRETFKSVQYWVKEAKARMGEDTQIMIVGCKADQQQDRKVYYEEGLYLGMQHDAIFIETSSKTQLNIDQMQEMIMGEKLISQNVEPGCAKIIS